MYILVFLLCINSQHLLNINNCEIYELVTPKEDIQINKENIMKYAKRNYKQASMFTIIKEFE